MEPFNLKQLSLILDQELVVVPEDFQKLKLAETLPPPHAEHVDPHQPETETDTEDPLNAYQTKEEIGQEDVKITHEGNFEKGVLVIFDGSELDPASREFLMK